MFVKFLVLVLALFTIGETSPVPRDSLYLCPVPPEQSRLLIRATVKKNAALLGTVTEIFNYPSVGDGTIEITCIIVNDLDPSGNGGTVTVLRGGPGSKEVEIQLTSKFMHGLNYEISVYGKIDKK